MKDFPVEKYEMKTFKYLKDHYIKMESLPDTKTKLIVTFQTAERDEEPTGRLILKLGHKVEDATFGISYHINVAHYVDKKQKKALSFLDLHENKNLVRLVREKGDPDGDLDIPVILMKKEFLPR